MGCVRDGSDCDIWECVFGGHPRSHQIQDP